jgi:hypothetical protein
LRNLLKFRVSAVIFDKLNNLPVVILENKRLNRIIPIWIGSCEAVSIAMALKEDFYPRPLTHDLLLDVLSKLEFDIKSVIIYQVKKDVFYAYILIADNETEELKIDARPSDAIALAVRKRVNIFVERDVVLESGITLVPSENYRNNEEVENFLKKIRKMKGDSDNGRTEGRKN